MNAEHRTWLPFILTGITLGIIVVFFVAGEPAQTSSQPSVEEQRFAPTQEEYQADVLAILGAFDTNGDAEQARDALLEMTVPVADRDVHLELVIVFGEFSAGKMEEGEARMDLLKSQVSWLN